MLSFRSPRAYSSRLHTSHQLPSNQTSSRFVPSNAHSSLHRRLPAAHAFNFLTRLSISHRRLPAAHAFNFINRLSISLRQSLMASSLPPLSQRFHVDSSIKGSVAVVTGANKGIGFEVARGLAALGFKTVLCARQKDAGLEAVDKIKVEFPSAEVHWVQLEITDEASRAAFVATVREKFGSVSVLVNNAGFAYKGSIFGAKEAEETIGVNYAGTRGVCEAVLPLLTANGRIVNVSSRAGSVRILQPEIRNRLQGAQTPQDLDVLARDFVSAIAEGNYKQKGFPSSMYGFSKALESAYTRILAAQHSADPRGLVVTAVCPGYVSTAMSSFGGDRTPEEGADSIIHCAVAPASVLKNGSIYGERTEIQY